LRVSYSFCVNSLAQKDFPAALEEKSCLVVPSILAERSRYLGDQGWCEELPTLRKEAFVTWKLTKTTKKRTADALNDAQAANEDDDDDEEDGGLMVTPPRDGEGRVVW
jgi:hypothetical protein